MKKLYEIILDGGGGDWKQDRIDALEYDFDKLYNWVMDENRKPSNTAFTASKARNIASAIELMFAKKS